VSEHLQHERAALRVMTDRMHRVALPPLDHAEDRLRLPTLSVLLFRKSTMHQAAISPVRRPGAGPPDLRRDDRSNAQVKSQVLVHPLGIVARIKCGHADTPAAARIAHHTYEWLEIRRRPTGGGDGENEVGGAVRGDARLRKAPVRRGLVKRVLQAFLASPTSPDEVPADVPRFEPARIHGDEVRRRLENPRLFRTTDGGVVQTPEMRLAKQSRRGLLQRREVWRLLQLDDGTEITAVFEKGGNGSILEVQHGLQHETRKELMLRVLLRAVLMRVRRKGFLRNPVGDPHHRPWRVTGLHPS